jgi:hypothetical protein
MNGQPRVPDIKWQRELATLDEDRLRALLSTLSVAEQADLVLSLDWERRMRVIKNSPEPAEVVRRMPDEEVLLTMKGMGEDDTLDLIALTSPAQLRFILDVELWTRDTVEEDKVLRWLGYLIGCGEDKVIEFVKTVDRELLVIVLGKLLYLIPNEFDTPGPSGAANIMPDEHFTILSRIPEETENTKLLLRIMRQFDRDLFYGLLFEVYGSADAETEERAFGWRRSRLEEKGLLEFEEAVEIYGYLGDEESLGLAGTREPYPARAARPEPPLYPVRLVGTKTFFARVLASLEDRQLLNRLRGEIAFAANRLLVADAGSIGEIESMKAALDRLFSLVNVGLLFLTEGDAARAHEVLRRLSVRDLFQVGLSRAIDLKTSATRAAGRWWPAWRDEGFKFLGVPEEGIMAGLMERVPQYHALGLGEGVGYRDFQSMDEIVQTSQVLDEIVAGAEICFDCLGIPGPAAATLETGRVFAGGVEEINLKNLLATAFVNCTLRGVLDIEPLRRDDVRKVFETMLEDAPSGGRRLKRQVVEMFVGRLGRISGRSGKDLLPLERFARKAVAALEEELKGIPSWIDLDPRYVTSVILEKPSQRGRPNG